MSNFTCTISRYTTRDLKRLKGSHRFQKIKKKFHWRSNVRTLHKYLNCFKMFRLFSAKVQVPKRWFLFFFKFAIAAACESERKRESVCVFLCVCLWERVEMRNMWNSKSRSHNAKHVGANFLLAPHFTPYPLSSYKVNQFIGCIKHPWIENEFK